MARERKVALKSIGSVKGKSALKAQSTAKNHAQGHSRSGGKKNKFPDRRGAEYRERLNRATKFVIDLHREALKELEAH